MSTQIHSPTFCHNYEEKILKCKEFFTQILASRSQYKKTGKQPGNLDGISLTGAHN